MCVGSGRDREHVIEHPQGILILLQSSKYLGDLLHDTFCSPSCNKCSSTNSTVSKVVMTTILLIKNITILSNYSLLIRWSLACFRDIHRMLQTIFISFSFVGILREFLRKKKPPFTFFKNRFVYWIRAQWTCKCKTEMFGWTAQTSR